MSRRRRHVAAAVGLLVVGACSHPHPAPAVRATHPAPELPALDTATYADVVPVTTTVAPEPVTTTSEAPVAPVATPVPVTTTTEPAGEADRQKPSVMGGRCGGDLPPCYVVQRESGGDPGAVNPSSGAAGKWQMLPSTSAALGYPRPMNTYDEATQDEAAAKLYAQVGCSAWDC